jgi:hypothetical protein
MDAIILQDTRKGLKIGRRYTGHRLDRSTKSIHVYYEQFLITPDGSEAEHEPRTYIIQDLPTQYRQKNSIKVPAVYSQKDGSIEEPAELYDGTEVLYDGHTDYSDWIKKYAEIEAEINATLEELPGHVPNMYHLGNPSN